jgi:hypothetical protein
VTPRATLEQAVQVAGVLSPAFHHAGYCLGLYGSVLIERQGKDLDFLAVPWRLPSEEPADIVLRYGFEILDRYAGLVAYSFTAARRGLVIDVRVTHWEVLQ